MLIGKNIILRPLKKEDITRTNEWRNDIDIIKLSQGIRFPKTVEMDIKWFDWALNDMSNANIFWGIDVIESGDFIGIIQLNHIDYISGTAIHGLIIGDSSCRGKGYSVEALRLMYDYAFNVLNLRKVFGYPLSTNTATLKMHEKIGMYKQEGRLERQYYFDGQYHDVLILSLFREDYLQPKGLN